MAVRRGYDPRETVTAIAQNYIGMNPVEPFVFHGISTAGFRQEPDGRYAMDMNARFPDAPMGAYCYIAGRFTLDSPVRRLTMAVNCFGPVMVWLNGENVFCSQCAEEVDRDLKKLFSVPLPAGENLFVIRVRKVGSGFGCVFGAEKDLADPKRYGLPWAGKQAYRGFAWSAPVTEPLDGCAVPACGMTEAETGLCWYPRTEWEAAELARPQMERMFGIQPGARAYAMTRFHTGFCRGGGEIALRGTCFCACVLRVDGRTVRACGEGAFAEGVRLPCGVHTLTVEAVCGPDGFGFDLEIMDARGAACPTESPFPVQGVDSPWVYLGLLDGPVDHEALIQPQLVHQGKYWRLDLPDMNLRPYIEAPRYGRWTYPLGVTLYGMYRAGKLLGRPDFSDYARGHIRLCAQLYSYALWDRDTYGYPTVDPKLVHMKMLDDCGSCGSTMLEMHRDRPEPEFESLAREIADFMEKRIERKPDGAFCRMQQGVHYQTLWADDLYMGTPFLTRYALAADEPACMDDAAEQFLLFKKYLYMEETHLMSHVYSFSYGMRNGQPWGRGNGWVLFSLTELLEKMPENHSRRPALLEFFRTLSRGVLAVQGEHGLWHQILTDPDAYEETSCTAMFTYAFCRGIRLGLYGSGEAGEYCRAAARAWRGIAERAVDVKGNVYGVCWGSQYSFQPDYYTKKLLWAPNDTHGIGIVMLAGIEFELLEEYLNNNTGGGHI